MAAKLSGMDTAMMSRMKELEDENRRLKIRDSQCVDSYVFILFSYSKSIRLFVFNVANA
jgi:hypothetical protein